MRGIALALVCSLMAAPALAQDDEAARIAAPAPPAPAPPPSGASATLSYTPPDPFGPAAAERFHDLRLGHREARNTEGAVLLGFGAASMVFGGLSAGIGYQDERWLGFGVGTAIWGALNAVFCLIFFDLDGHVLRDIESGRTLRGRELDQAREDWAASQYSTATTIAVNAGLDVFYILGGIMLYVIANQMSPELRWLEGYGIAMASQGVGLAAFDITTWIAAAQRGDATRTLFRDPEGDAP